MADASTGRGRCRPRGVVPVGVAAVAVMTVGIAAAAFGAPAGDDAVSSSSPAVAPADEPFETSTSAPRDDAFRYGDDDVLDDLWDECDAGDLAACDALYVRSPVRSDYEWFGSTCGDRQRSRHGSCDVPAPVETVAPPPPMAPSTTATTRPIYGYGDDALMDSLWNACAAGELMACDQLYVVSPIGSAYEYFASTCGTTGEHLAGRCALAVPPLP